MTGVPSGEGWLYLAPVLDLCVRKFAGRAMSETTPQELTLCARDVALVGAKPPGTSLGLWDVKNPKCQVGASLW
jgi:transposase InsO family protein